MKISDIGKLGENAQAQIRRQLLHDRPDTRSTARKQGVKEIETIRRPSESCRMIEMHLSGEIVGGKNHIGITKSGRRYPRPAFAKWRAAAIGQIVQQHPRRVAFTSEVSATITYRSPTRRRHDAPAIIDAIFHVIEKTGIVADDALITRITFDKKHDPDNPGCDIMLKEKTTT